MLVTNSVMVDYLRLKSFREGFDKAVLSLFGYDIEERRGSDGWEQKKWMQYTGVGKGLDHGHVWAGVGKQKLGGKGSYLDHSVADISGAAAEYSFDDIRKIISPDFCKFGRIDLQVTIERPEWWQQEKFMTDLLERGVNVGWPTPETDRDVGKLRTVYINSRKSSRYYRIYEKKTVDGRVLLRFETEYKYDRGEQVGWRVARKKEDAWSILWSDLKDIPHRWVFKALTPVFEGVQPAPIVVGEWKKRDKTKNWLIGLVLPTFVRFINEHDDDGEVARLFAEEIERSAGWEPFVDEMEEWSRIGLV